MSIELTAETAIRIGGWDPRYARVLAIGTLGDAAVTLIDPNGDGNHHEIEHLLLDDTGQWRPGGSSGGDTPDTLGLLGWGEYTPDAGPGVRYAYGRTMRPGAQLVTLETPPGYVPTAGDDWWVGCPLAVTATGDGWWRWIQRVCDDL